MSRGRPRRPLPPEIGLLSDGDVARLEAARGHHTTAAAIRELRYSNGIPAAVSPGFKGAKEARALRDDWDR